MAAADLPGYSVFLEIVLGYVLIAAYVGM